MWGEGTQTKPAGLEVSAVHRKPDPRQQYWTRGQPVDATRPPLLSSTLEARCLFRPLPEGVSRDPLEDERRRIRRPSLHERDFGSLFRNRPSRRDTCPKQALPTSPSASPLTSSRCSETWPRKVLPGLTPSTLPDLAPAPAPASSLGSRRPGTSGAICAMDEAWRHHPAGTVLCA